MAVWKGGTITIYCLILYAKSIIKFIMPRRAKPLKIKDADENKIFECSKISKS
jgi:hypothetical protein